MKQKLSIAKAGKEELSSAIIRFISKPFSYFFINFTNMHPNHVTILSFLFALASAYFLMQGGYDNLVIGALLAFGYAILDCVDGDIARTKKLFSKTGLWLEGITGFVANEIIILGIILGLNTILAYQVGILAMIAFPMQFAIVHFYKSEVVKTNRPMDIGKSGKLEFLRYLYGTSLFYVLLIILAIANKPLWFLMFFAFIGNLFWLGLVFIQFLNIRRG